MNKKGIFGLIIGTIILNGCSVSVSGSINFASIDISFSYLFIAVNFDLLFFPFRQPEHSLSLPSPLQCVEHI